MGDSCCEHKMKSSEITNANTLRYIRFIVKDKKNAKPQTGILKTFHFSAEHPQQILVLDKSPFEEGFGIVHVGHKTIPLEDVKILAPTVPSKIIGIGLNYKDHALEQGKQLPQEPYVFLKAVSALLNPRETVKLNRYCTDVHFEAELAVVIGKPCYNTSEKDALDYIAGYTIANDVTDRVIQKKELTYARAKGMDTFCPLGPYLVHFVDDDTNNADMNWKNKTIRTWINGELKQDGNTNDMVFSVPYLIHYVSQFMTLYPGDVILTGTPKGTAALKSGDKVKIEIQDFGILEHAVE